MSYREIRFSFSQSDYCCGVVVIGDFTEMAAVSWNRAAAPGKTFPTARARNENLFEKLVNELVASTDRHDLDENEEGYTYCYGLVTATLVRSGRSEVGEQVEGLIDFLQEKGWKIDNEFVNPKTDNTVVHMSWKCND